MKRLIFYTLILIGALTTTTINAQGFKQTWHSPCKNCAPGYEIVSGSPAISNPSGYGGDVSQPWLKWNLAAPADPPSYVNGEQQESDPYAVYKSFLTLGHINHPKGSIQDVVRVTIPKFVIGKVYNFHFATMFSKLASSSDAKSISVKITTAGNFPTILKTATFTPLNINNWVNTELGFTATSDVLVFTFSVEANVGTTAYVNLDIARYPFDCVIPTAQVQLFHANLTTRYPCGRRGLDFLEKSATPPNGILIWKKGDSYSNEDLADNLIKDAPVGEYYAFYRDQTMPKCLNVQMSSAKAVLTYVPEQISLVKTVVVNNCPESTVSLNVSSIVDAKQALQSNEERRWFKNNNHQGVPENASAISTSGDYYAFLYNKQYNCYSTDLSTSKVTVTIKACCAAGTAQVALSRSNAVNTCPETTVNLNNTKVTNQPPFTSVVWFSDAAHTVAVADPAKAGAGTYYAFFKDNAAGCFNTDLSTTKLTVSINPCDTKVSLNLKVFLQGPTTQEGGVATMRNDLQVYPTGPSTVGLLPTQDPYGGGAIYPEIKNTFSKAGNVVDWVKVEIRSMQDPSVVLESKSLLLRVDGTVLDVDGFAPKFNPQFGGVRIAVKHRNHVPIIGLGLVSFNAGTVNYDFSTSLSKAYNVGAPAQMVMTSGVWCMPIGDVQQDYVVDNVDYAIFDSSFNKGDFDVYSPQDLNLDGLVDNVDYSFFDFSFNAGFFSTLINY
ncbi:hypothetical protein [Dyadobacter fanqingshengii]|uniref:Ig-like domain-containing protein n=1 Tax=Dyadobacter fanqingshengii TaxID=2906443 RepID=A0A9X1PC08_9BACT|nr:hypothetical protein [Dyadobacter fanqingshengii]MCF0042191.1 hypothetical protein [Dyadobacter fanqingshengii]USJ35277.1 hypothetical protein NFI81_21605 [Dyadobacter fanqingshengii]